MTRLYPAGHSAQVDLDLKFVRGLALATKHGGVLACRAK